MHGPVGEDRPTRVTPPPRIPAADRPQIARGLGVLGKDAEGFKLRGCLGYAEAADGIGRG